MSRAEMIQISDLRCAKADSYYRLFAGVQKLLQISILFPEAFRSCSLLFVWVAARLLHANPILSAQSSYLHLHMLFQNKLE